MCEEIAKGLYQIRAREPGCHAYLIRGERMNVLIDSGVQQHAEELQAALASAGIKVSDVHLLINTHEHFDHIGANKIFQGSALVAAHRNAAVKIVYADEEVTMCRANAQEISGYGVHLWLENINLIDAGGWKLKVLYTPGHTSGCISVYEPRKRILFSGDAVFAGGTISNISKSGNYGEYANSLRRLATMKIELLLPGHGAISTSPEEDIIKAAENAESKMAERIRMSESAVPSEG